jgi:hypothetical protein
MTNKHLTSQRSELSLARKLGQAQRCCTLETKASNTEASNKHNETPCSCMPCTFLQGTGQGKINTPTSSGGSECRCCCGDQGCCCNPLSIQTTSATHDSCVNIHETRCRTLPKVQAGMQTARCVYCVDFAAERRSALEPVSCDSGNGTADTVHAPQTRLPDSPPTASQLLPGTA